MLRCEHCQEKLLDLVFDLVEESEAVALRAHLQSCAQCQNVFVNVQGQEKLLTQAARAIHAVPEFALPSDSTPTLPTEAPTPVPVSTPAPRRPVWRRGWIGAGAVAASLILVVGALSFLQHGNITQLRDELAAKRAEYKKIDERYAGVPVKYLGLQKEAIAAVNVKAPLHLNVTGPAHIQAGAKASLQLTLRHLDGGLAREHVVVKLMDEAAGKTMRTTRVQCNGHARVELDAHGAMPGSKLRVVVEADEGRARVEDAIEVAAPSYTMRVDSNKFAYEVSEVLFFRVLVLDRWSLTPPVERMVLNVKLLNPKNEVVAEFKRATDAGGILAGELPIGTDYLAGNYLLEITSVDAASRVRPASMRFEVVRDLPTPDIQFNQPRYMPGDVLSGGFFLPPGQAAPRQLKATVGGEPVPVTIDPQPTLAAATVRGGAPGGAGMGSATKAKDVNKGATLAAPMLQQRFHFSLPIPKAIPEGATKVPIKLELQNGGEKKAYNADVLLEPTDYAIDLFPEGGDLVAGVANKVFFRVRSRSGQAVTGDGRVILLSNKNLIVDAPYHLGLGSLEFTPELKETYTLRVTSPIKTTEIAQPFAKLGMRTAGIVLHVPTAVGKQGDTIEVTLRNQGPPRKLLLVAQCRQQIVDQCWVDVQSGSASFTLETTPLARGMIRVTAYEADGDMLRPLAERLVYRTTRETLNVAAAFNTQTHVPGQKMLAKVTAKDETGKPAPAWVLASVVDERFQTKTRSLSAHFMLFAETGSSGDLDSAQVVLNDAPESLEMLERFLGTHGWRRFVRSSPAGTEFANAGIWSRENAPLESLRKQHEDRLDAALTPLRVAAFTEQNDIDLKRIDAGRAVEVAAAELFRAETRPEPVRVALGVLILGLLLASLTMLGIALYRTARKYEATTPAFAGAFGCLAGCLVMIFVGNAMGPRGVSNPAPFAIHSAPWQDRVALENQLAPPTLAPGRASPLPTGALALAAPSNGKALTSPPVAQAKADGNPELPEMLQRDQILRHFTAHARSESAAFGGNQLRRNDSDAMRARFRNAQVAGFSGAPPVQPTTPPAVAKKGDPRAHQAIEREFAPRFAPDLISDTLLWNPTLWLVDGNGEVAFHIANGQATYRFLLLAHTPTGRLGYFETRLDVAGVRR